MFNVFQYSANNHAKESNRKTLTGHDVIEALDEMEFSQFIEPLKESLEGKYHYFYKYKHNVYVLKIWNFDFKISVFSI